jgi:hypothetical protein
MIIQQMQLQQGKPCLLVKVSIIFHVVFSDTKFLHQTPRDVYKHIFEKVPIKICFKID